MLLLENMPFLSLPKAVDAKAMRRLTSLSVDGTVLHVLHVPMVECCPVQGFVCILILLCLIVRACVYARVHEYVRAYP